MKRPPRLVWVIVNSSGTPVHAFRTRKAAIEYLGSAFGACRVVGPFYLAERMREK